MKKWLDKDEISSLERQRSIFKETVKIDGNVTKGEFVGQSYTCLAIGIPIFILVQSLLFIHTLHREFVLRKDPAFASISKRARLLYILLQLMGLFWYIADLFRLIIDPPLLFRTATDSVGLLSFCNVIGYSCKIIPGMFYAVFLYQILLRIASVFETSHLAFGSRTLFVLKLLVLPIFISS